MSICTAVLCLTLAGLLRAEPGSDLESGARCLHVRGSEFVRKGDTHVQEEIPVMDILQRSLDMIIQNDEPNAAFVQEGLLCNNEGLLLDFGSLISVTEALEYQFDLNIALDILIVYSNEQVGK